MSSMKILSNDYRVEKIEKRNSAALKYKLILKSGWRFHHEHYGYSDSLARLTQFLKKAYPCIRECCKKEPFDLKYKIKVAIWEKKQREEMTPRNKREKALVDYWHARGVDSKLKGYL